MQNANQKSRFVGIAVAGGVHALIILFIVNPPSTLEHKTQPTPVFLKLLVNSPRTITESSTAIVLPPINMPEIAPPNFTIAPPRFTIVPPSQALDLSIHPVPFDPQVPESIKNFSIKEHNSSAETIFDPRIRKLLKNKDSTYKSEKNDAYSDWVDPHGVKYVNMGNGTCIKSMPAFKDTAEQMWSLPFPCDKDIGDKMIDNLRRNLKYKK